MLLSCDIGNTEITFGLFETDRLLVSWRMTTVTQRTPDEWMTAVTSYLGQGGYAREAVRAAACASVAPGVTQGLLEGIEQAIGVHPVLVGPDSPLPIVLDVEEPMTVGADRVVNTLATVELYRRDTIVVDFGTATTFDCIVEDGRFIGGVIAPGVQTAAENLTRKAAKLPATELTAPPRVIGRRTEDCVRAGVVFGNVDATDGIVRRIKAEWPTASIPFVVATGGLASRIADQSTEIEAVEPDLTLIGLQVAARHLGLEW